MAVSKQRGTRIAEWSRVNWWPDGDTAQINLADFWKQLRYYFITKVSRWSVAFKFSSDLRMKMKTQYTGLNWCWIYIIAHKHQHSLRCNVFIFEFSCLFIENLSFAIYDNDYDARQRIYIYIYIYIYICWADVWWPTEKLLLGQFL